MRGNYTQYISGSNPRQKLVPVPLYGSRGGNIGRWFNRVVIRPVKSAAEGAIESLAKLGAKKGAELLMKKGAEKLPGLLSSAAPALSSMAGSFLGRGTPPEQFIRLAHPNKGVNIHEFYGSGMSKLDPKAQQRMAEGLNQINKLLGIN